MNIQQAKSLRRNLTLYVWVMRLLVLLILMMEFHGMYGLTPKKSYLDLAIMLAVFMCGFVWATVNETRRTGLSLIKVEDGADGEVIEEEFGEEDE